MISPLQHRPYLFEHSFFQNNVLLAIVHRDEHILTDAGVARLTFIMEEKYSDKGNEGNAKFIRNLYRNVQKKQAKRLSKEEPTTKFEFSTITDKNIPNEV